MRSLLSLSLLLASAACVAPEEKPMPRSTAAQSYRPDTSGAVFEDAPRPNRKVGNTNDSVIRMAR